MNNYSNRAIILSRIVSIKPRDFELELSIRCTFERSKLRIIVSNAKS